MQTVSREELLAEAVSIGDMLVECSFRMGERHNWVNRVVIDASNRQKLQDRTAQATLLGPTVYSGVAGLGLFLAHLYRATDDPRYRKVARGALLEALYQANGALEGTIPNGYDRDPREVNADVALGFYAGHVGPVWAALDLWEGLQDTHLRDTGRTMARKLMAYKPPAKAADDVIGGHAGAILAYLSVARTVDMPEAMDAAKQLGDELLSKAKWKGEVVSWKSQTKAKRGLTGFSHGAAGYAHALACLAEATGEETYEEAARAALRYERESFDADQKNWPDFRTPTEDGGFTCLTLWCHGAGGIGLSRAHLPAKYQDATSRAEIEAAAEAMRRSVRLHLEYGGAQHNYCHGLTGNAECLWEMEEALGQPGAYDRAIATASLSIRRYGSQAQEAWDTKMLTWPTGHFGYTEFSLLLGVAGVGYNLLRLYSPKGVPSVLIPGLSWR